VLAIPCTHVGDTLHTHIEHMLGRWGSSGGGYVYIPPYKFPTLFETTLRSCTHLEHNWYTSMNTTLNTGGDTKHRSHDTTLNTGKPT